MEINFKTKNDKQIEAFRYWTDDETEEILYGGAKGGGKSFLGASLIFADALIYPETHYFIARKELNDLRKFTIPTIGEVFQKWKLDIRKYAPYNGQDNCFKLYNGSVVFLIPCKDEPSDPMFERFGSMQMTRGWIEEAGEVAEAARNNLWLSIGRWKNDKYHLRKKMLETANPKKGWLKREFVDPFRERTLPPSKKYIQAFATDNTYLPEGYVDTLRDQKDKVARQRLYEGNWDYDDDQDSLITYDALSDAFSNTIVKSNEKYLIVDVARLGRDTTVFSFWNGLEITRIEQFHKQGTDKTEQQIRDFAAIDKIPFSHILVDEDGIGGAVCDHLVGVKGFTANSTPIATAAQVRERQTKISHEFIAKGTFSNLKSQCGWKIAELINEHKVTFKVPDLRETIIEELTAQLRDHEPDSEARKRLRPKDEVKVDLGRSPDIGDTIIMRAFFELARDASIIDEPAHALVMEEQTIRLGQNKRNREVRSNK